MMTSPHWSENSGLTVWNCKLFSSLIQTDLSAALPTEDKWEAVDYWNEPSPTDSTRLHGEAQTLLPISLSVVPLGEEPPECDWDRDGSIGWVWAYTRPRSFTGIGWNEMVGQLVMSFSHHFQPLFLCIDHWNDSPVFYWMRCIGLVTDD